jgi:hypothetical protein
MINNLLYSDCQIVPLQAEQGGINFTPFVLSLPYTHKKDERYLGGILNFFPRKKLGLIQEKKNFR